ncbi:MAG: hypothetical protein ACK559_05170, partial [bacterium]
PQPPAIPRQGWGPDLHQRAVRQGEFQTGASQGLVRAELHQGFQIAASTHRGRGAGRGHRPRIRFSAVWGGKALASLRLWRHRFRAGLPRRGLGAGLALRCTAAPAAEQRVQVVVELRKARGKWNVSGGAMGLILAGFPRLTALGIAQHRIGLVDA